MITFKIQKFSNWVVISVNDRVDSNNFVKLKQLINEKIDQGELSLVLDLESTAFLSLPSIKFFAEVASLISKKGGALALLTPSEKLKRQIHIYASLEEMKLFRSRQDLERAGGEPVPFEQQGRKLEENTDKDMQGII